THAIHRRSGGRESHPLRNLNPLADALVVGNHKIPPPAAAELADDGGMRPLKHIHDFPVRPPISFQALNADGAAVTMHGPLGFFFAQVDIALDPGHRLIGNQKAIAVAVHGQAPVDQARRFFLLRMATLQMAFGMRRHDSFYSEKAYGPELFPAHGTSGDS